MKPAAPRKEKDLKALFADDQRGAMEVKGPGGVLAYIIRRMWADSGARLGDLDHSISRFIMNARKNTENKSVANYFNRSNLRREIAKPAMTWKVFLRSLRVQEVASFKLTIEFRFKNRYKPNITIPLVVDLGKFSEEELEEDGDGKPGFLLTAGDVVGQPERKSLDTITNRAQTSETQETNGHEQNPPL